MFIDMNDLNTQINIKKVVCIQKTNNPDFWGPGVGQSGPQKQKSFGIAIQKKTACSFLCSINKYVNLFSLFAVSHPIRNNKFNFTLSLGHCN